MPSDVVNPLAAMVGYLDAERKQRQQRDDTEIDSKIALLHDLITGPGANPARTAQGYQDILDLMSAKGGKGKRTQGVGGFLGDSQIPVSTLLAGLTHGTIPFQGPTTGTVQHPGFESAADQPMDPSQFGHMVQPQFTGKSILESPVPIPPAPIGTLPTGNRMMSAARQMQSTEQLPMDQQPLRRSPEEMSQMAANAERAKAGATTAGMYDADIQAAQTIAGQPENVQETLRGMKGFNRPPTNRTSAHNAKVDGKDQVVWVDPVSKIITGMDGQPVTGSISLAGTSAGKTTGSTFTQHIIKDAQGNYMAEYLPKDPNDLGGDAQNVTSVDLGVKGSIPQPPQGTVGSAVDPATGQPSLFRVQGTTATPIKIAGSGQTAVKPATPEKMSAAGKQALLGIGVVTGVIPGLLQDLQTAGLSNNPIGQTWDLALARRGISPGQFEEKILQTLGIADAYGLRGLMGGRPNQSLMEIIRVHLPQPGDSTQLAWDKLHTLQTTLPTIKQAIIEAEGTQLPQKNPYGGGNSIPNPPNVSAAGGGGKAPVTAEQVRRYATEHGIDEEAARKVFIDNGNPIVK